MKMKEAMLKVKEFVKKHPIVTGLVILTAGTGVSIAISSHTKPTPTTSYPPIKYEPLPDREFNFTVGEKMWDEIGNNWIEIMIDDVHTDNLGKLGEEISAQISELQGTQGKVQVMINAYDLKKIEN